MAPNNYELIDIYKLHVQMADNVSSRRGKTNQFYLTLLSAIFIAISFIFEKQQAISSWNVLVIAACILGIVISIVWWLNIVSYKKLNSVKFQILCDLEKKLPYDFLTKEWDDINSNKDNDKYVHLSKIEQFLPWFLMIVFTMLLCFLITNN